MGWWALLVLAEPNENVWKSFRNFPGLVVRPARDLCAFDVVAGPSGTRVVYTVASGKVSGEGRLLPDSGVAYRVWRPQ